MTDIFSGFAQMIKKAFGGIASIVLPFNNNGENVSAISIVIAIILFNLFIFLLSRMSGNIRLSNGVHAASGLFRDSRSLAGTINRQSTKIKGE